jgi:putative membrane protein
VWIDSCWSCTTAIIDIDFMPTHFTPATGAAQAKRPPALLRGVSARVPWRTHVGYGMCVALVGLMLWSGIQGQHMLLHVLMMSVLAPLVVTAVRHRCSRIWHTRPQHLWLAALLQLAVFLYWHSPSGMMGAMHTDAGELLLQASLLAVASLFWWCIAGLESDRVWHAIAALLCTGKLFCLVAVVLTFAPRPLYHAMALSEQQLAGLIMITLCPLTYVASALWLCRRWLGGLSARTPAPQGPVSCS